MSHYDVLWSLRHQRPGREEGHSEQGHDVRKPKIVSDESGSTDDDDEEEEDEDQEVRSTYLKSTGAAVVHAS